MFVPLVDYSLATYDGAYADRPLTTPLLLKGVAAGSSVPGYVIEGQYRWHEYLLLITSWDCPFEESYDFLLLDAAHQIVARTSLGAPYGSYLLHAHWPIDDRSLRLHFYRADCYTLMVQRPAGWWRRRPRLRLVRHRRTPRDERTQASVDALRAQLAAIDESSSSR